MSLETTVNHPLPPNNLVKISEKVESTLEGLAAGETASSAEDTDNDELSSCGKSNDSSDRDINIQSLNTLALRDQLQSRLKHELTTLLPRLHGLSILLEEEAKFPVENSMFNELHDVISKIYHQSVDRHQNRSPNTLLLVCQIF